MLSIRNIAITDFGPFKNEQQISLPDEDGVVIVYGENMRGKTTLLNAIRYALFGKVLTRGSVELKLHQIGNWESAAAGKYGFKVVLTFRYDSRSYQLTRECRLRPGVQRPTTDLDYIEDSFLQRDGAVLGPDEATLELGRIMPETVSRFFLFDGELLQQYEELLRSESEMGRQIKEAIERILGVPVLTNGRADLHQLHQDAQYQESRAAQRNQKTQQLGNLHGELLTRREAMQRESDRLRQDLERLRQTKTAKEEQARKQEQLRALLGQRDRLQEEIKSLEGRISEKVERRKDLLTTAWRSMLSPRIKVLRVALEEELKGLRESVTRDLVQRETLEAVSAAIATGRCTMCQQDLSQQARQHLEAILAKVGGTTQTPETTEAIRVLESRLVQLRDQEGGLSMDALREISGSIDELRVTKATTEDRLREIREQTEGLDESELRRLYTEYERTVQEIGVVENGIKEQESALGTINESIIRIESELVKKGGNDLQKERKRREICEQLRNLFEEGVTLYRDQLRQTVETDATTLFQQLTSEPDYAGLRINDSYGLTIVHRDGTNIPVRSAGAEHIVALSLMGSLQRNAPLRGPIIMDSPFGRLDNVHTTKVVHTLPNMAKQVVLFVYESELEPAVARSELRGSLRAEYRIVRRSARHSSIEKVI